LKPQKTIANEVRLAGKGMFGGKDVKVLFKSAPAGSGVVFVRTDFDPPVRIEASIDNISPLPRRTAVTKGNAGVEMIEHCLAAVSALEIDNIIIEMTAQEMPCFDGGSGEYFKALKKAGLTEQNAVQNQFVISQEISISQGGASIYALPGDGDGLEITYEMDYTGHTGVGRQLFSCELSADFFEANLAPARTFLLEAEAKQFQSRGIGTHLSPRDILVINSDGPIKNTFRFRVEESDE